MNYTNDNGASNMNTVKNNGRTSAMVPQDCEELRSDTIKEEIACAQKSLSKEETSAKVYEMVAASLRDDGARREEVRDKIFRSLILLVLKITCNTVKWHRNQYFDASISFSDYLHEGYSALYKAIDTFNPDNGASLATYAYTLISHHLNDFAFIRKRRDGKIREIKSLEETYGEDWTNKIGDIIADNAESAVSAVGSKEAFNALWCGIGQLSKRERDCLCARFELGKDCSNLADIAERYGISRPRASQIANDAVNKLRKYLVEELGAA